MAGLTAERDGRTAGPLTGLAGLTSPEPRLMRGGRQWGELALLGRPILPRGFVVFFVRITSKGHSMKYLVFLDAASVVGKIYLAGNNDGKAPVDGVLHPALNCVTMKLRGPFSLRRAGD